jgi:hypothetical protein
MRVSGDDSDGVVRSREERLVTNGRVRQSEGERRRGRALYKAQESLPRLSNGRIVNVTAWLKKISFSGNPALSRPCANGNEATDNRRSDGQKDNGSEMSVGNGMLA